MFAGKQNCQQRVDHHQSVADGDAHTHRPSARRRWQRGAPQPAHQTHRGLRPSSTTTTTCGGGGGACHTRRPGCTLCIEHEADRSCSARAHSDRRCARGRPAMTTTSATGSTTTTANRVGRTSSGGSSTTSRPFGTAGPAAPSSTNDTGGRTRDRGRPRTAVVAAARVPALAAAAATGAAVLGRLHRRVRRRQRRAGRRGTAAASRRYSTPTCGSRRRRWPSTSYATVARRPARPPGPASADPARASTSTTTTRNQPRTRNDSGTRPVVLLLVVPRSSAPAVPSAANDTLPAATRQHDNDRFTNAAHHIRGGGRSRTALGVCDGTDGRDVGPGARALLGFLAANHDDMNGACVASSAGRFVDVACLRNRLASRRAFRFPASVFRLVLWARRRLRERNGPAATPRRAAGARRRYSQRRLATPVASRGGAWTVRRAYRSLTAPARCTAYGRSAVGVQPQSIGGDDDRQLRGRDAAVATLH